MAKKTCAGGCKNPKERSKKDCCCGGHQGKRGKKPRKRWSREKPPIGVKSAADMPDPEDMPYTYKKRRRDINEEYY